MVLVLMPMPPTSHKPPNKLNPNALMATESNDAKEDKFYYDGVDKMHMQNNQINFGYVSPTGWPATRCLSY